MIECSDNISCLTDDIWQSLKYEMLKNLYEFVLFGSIAILLHNKVMLHGRVQCSIAAFAGAIDRK